uniref:GCN5 family N-acetyltransferase n=1 Tax=Thermosporothrix sp. COM3 TaxID=2490863 RepID=A0A455SN41_9CHLR|nr:GCN5 family N-acetyltransferase [Thermosporothrix sp. COM3]
MSELTISEVTRDNWRDTLLLGVYPEQQRFISDVVPIAAIALAKAYIRPGGLLWRPYAFYDDRTMIGFMMLAYEPDNTADCWMFHFFIDVAHQGKGYGKQALLRLLDFLKQECPACCALLLTVHPENMRAQRLYRGIGFQPTGEEREGEPIYRLLLR